MTTPSLSHLLGEEFATFCDAESEVPDVTRLDLVTPTPVTPGAVLHPAPGVDLSESRLETPRHHCAKSERGLTTDGVWRETRICSCGVTVWAESWTQPSTETTRLAMRAMLIHLRQVAQ